MAYRTSREHFERLVDAAIGTLPQEYTQYFTNITVFVEDLPGPHDLERLGTKGKGGLLLGLFSGVPHPYKGGFFEIPYPLPDRIILYQKNIETICSSEDELIEQIRKTLIHEAGHYFGLSEEDLRRYE
jgi:predicted Zn-dependent protease with MMP-like domain